IEVRLNNWGRTKRIYEVHVEGSRRSLARGEKLLARRIISRFRRVPLNFTSFPRCNQMKGGTAYTYERADAGIGVDLYKPIAFGLTRELLQHRFCVGELDAQSGIKGLSVYAAHDGFGSLIGIGAKR